MTEKKITADEERAVKRFATMEEFRREYYPKSTEKDAQKNQQEEDFGAELALDSLNRHAGDLRF